MSSDKTRSAPSSAPLVGAFDQTAARLAAPRPLPWPRRVLVGSDGTPASDAAVATARELAARTGASVETIVVHVPEFAIPGTPGVPGVPAAYAAPARLGFDRCEAPERDAAARLLRTVRRQRRELLREPRSWPLRLEVGEPVAVIVLVAEESGADLVVVGIGRPEPTDRRQGGRTALFAARQLTVPVYAAARGCERPSRAVIVLPDGHAHAPTIRRALACVQPGARVWLVLPRRLAANDGEPERGSARDIALRACGDEIAEHLDGCECQRVDMQGDMLTGVLQAAEEVDAQLVAVPVRGMPGPVRTFLPNIAEPLLLTARCSVLAVPDESPAAPAPRFTN